MYFRIYQFAIKISDDALNEMKPGFIIIPLEIFLFLQLYVWYSVIVNRFIEIPYEKYIFILAGIGIALFNYYVFLYRKKWKKFVKEFSAYSKKKKLQKDILILLIIFCVIIGLILSFYNLGKIIKQ